MTDIEFGILMALHQRGEIHGTDTLCHAVTGTGNNKKLVYRHALILVANGMIHMEPSAGGRGKKTIYRDAGVLKVQR